MNLGDIFRKLGLGKRHIFFVLLSIFVTVLTFAIWIYQLNHSPTTKAAAVTCYWVGHAAPNNNWSDINNWDAHSGHGGGDCDGGVVPDNDDTVVFDNANATNVNVDMAVNVAAMTNTDYAGTLIGNSYNVSVSGAATFKSGNLNMGSGTWTVSGDFDIRSAASFSVDTGSTLIMNGASKTLWGNNQTFYNITISNSVTARTAGSGNVFSANGTLKVDSGKTFTVYAGNTITVNKGAVFDLQGTVTASSSSTQVIMIDATSSSLGASGTIGGITFNFKTATQDATVVARTYRHIQLTNETGNNYNVVFGTAGGQTISMGDDTSLNANLYLATNGAGNLTLDAATNDPTVNVYSPGSSTSGNIDFNGTGGGSEAILAGDGTWTMDGSIDLTGGSLTPDLSTFIVRGKGSQDPIITSNGSPFYNLTFPDTGVVGSDYTFADAATVTLTFSATATSFETGIQFHASSTYDFANISMVGSSGGKVLTLTSSTPGTDWIFNVSQTTPSVYYVAVSDSDASGGSAIRAVNSTNNLGNHNWNFATAISIAGTIYTDEGKSGNIGAGKTVNITAMGDPISTVETGAGGTFSFAAVQVTAGDTLVIFLDNETPLTEEGDMVTQVATPAANIAGLEMYTQKVVISHASAGPITNANLAKADSTFDDDIKYTISGGNATFDANFELFIEGSKAYTPGGTISTGDIDINGTLTLGANAAQAAGNWDATGGTFTTSGTVTLSGATAQTITSNGRSFQNLTISNTHASGASLADTLNLNGNFTVAATGASNALFNAVTFPVNIAGNISMSKAAAGIPSITMGTNTWTVTGNVSFDDGTVNSGSSTLYLNTSATWQQTSFNSQTLNNLQINAWNDKYVRLNKKVYINGILTIGEGKWIAMFNDIVMNAGSSLVLPATTGMYPWHTYEKIEFIDSAGGNINTTGSIGCNALFNAVSSDVTVTARSYASKVTIKNSSGTAKTATLGTLGGQTITIGNNFEIDASLAGNMIVDGAANDPNVNIAGAIDYVGVGGGSESISMGDNTWTVGGNIDLTGGTLTPNSSTLILNGTTALTSANNPFNNVQIGSASAGGSLTTNDTTDINGTLSVTNFAATTFNITDDTVYFASTVNLTNLDTFTTTNSTAVFDGTTSLTSAGFVLNNVAIGTAGAGGSLTIADPADIDGTFSILNGGATTLVLTNRTLNLAAATIDLTNLDTFTTTNSTVTLDGAVAQTLTSATKSFNNLTIKTTHASGTILADALSVGGNLYLSADGASNVLLDAATNDPAVTVAGNIDFTGLGAGVEDIHMGDNTWTVAGNITLTDGTIDPAAGTLALNGTTSLTSATNYFNNVAIGTGGAGGSLTTNDTTDINGTLTVTNFAATALNISDDTVYFASTVNLTNLDTFTTTNSTAVFDGTTSLTSNSLSFNNVQLGTGGSGGSLTFSDTGDFNGTFIILNGGATTLNLTNQTLYLADSISLTNLDTFTDTNSTVTFDAGATGKTITSAAKHFNNIIFNNAAGGWSFADAAYIDGNFIVINSDTVGNGVNFNNQAIDINGNVQIDAGKLTAGSSLINVFGNWTRNGGTFVANTSGVTFDGTSGTKAITSGSQSFSNIAFNDGGGTATFRPIDALDVNGTFTLTDGILDLDTLDPNVNIAGNITIDDGSVTKGSGLVTFDGDLFYDDNVGGVNFGAIAIGTSPDTTTFNSNILCDSLRINFGDSLITQGYDIDTSGDIRIIGTLNATHDVTKGGTTLINLAGNWNATGGTFTPDDSTVTLDGNSAQSITAGGQSFNNLTVANTDATNGVTFADPATVPGIFTNTTPDSKVTFHAGSTYAFNALNIAGTAGHLITFVSSAPSTTWLLNVTEASPTADYVSATDSDASGGSAIDATTGSFNGGDNTNWIFAVATVTVAPASATLDQGATQAFTATAADAQGYNVPTAAFTWSVAADGGTITPAGLFTAGTAGGTFSNTVQATSGGVNGYASVTVNATPTPTPSGEGCTLGNITQVAIQDINFSTEPGGVKTLGITFLDAAGNPVDKSSVANFKMTPDYNSSYWNISSGGGRLADENLDTININFVAGGTRGSFNNTIIFSACGGTLKAYATPEIIKERTIYADIDPDTYALQPGESFRFDTSLYDDAQNPVNDICSYSWNLSDPSATSIESPAKSSTRVTANDKKGQYTLKVDINCAGQSLSTQAALAIFTIDNNTEWKLNSYFPSLVSWEGQRTYVGFLPYVKVSGSWYSRAETLDYTMTDPSAAKVVGLHSKYPNIPIVEATSAGCYPFLVGATLNRSGKSYFAATGMNIGANDQSSEYSKFQPTLGDSILSYQHLVKKNGENGIVLRRRDALGNEYSWFNWIYIGKSMTTKWILNDTRIGALRPYYNSAYLDTTNASYGYFPRALTTIIDFNDKQKIENWDIWIEKPTDKIRFSPSLPEIITIKPSSLFRLWQGYQYANWGEYIPAGYRVKSLDQKAVSVVNDTVTDIIFKSGEQEGTYKDAIVLGSAYSSGSMVGGTERKITIIVDNNATADLCSANAFAQVLGTETKDTGKEGTSKKSSSIWDIIRGIISAIGRFLRNILNWLNSHSIIALIIGFLLTLPALLAILGSLAIGNIITSISRWFSGLTATALPGKKNRRLGYVYDWESKKPIKGAKVSSFDTKSKRLVYQTITNAQGEFILYLPRGEYYLRVEKRGYRPYQTVAIESGKRFDGSRTDGYYEAIYLPSEIIEIKEGQEDFTHAISISLFRPTPKSNAILIAMIKFGGWLVRMSFVFLVIGTIMTVGLVIYDHNNWVNIVILLYYILVWILYLYRHFTFFSGTAAVEDQNGQPVDLALVRVFNDQSKLTQTVVSDRKGRFVLNLVKGQYKVRVRKAGYEVKEMNLQVNSLADINRIKIVL